LFVCTELADIRTNKAAVQEHEEAYVTVFRIFLEQDLFVTKIGNAGATVLLIRPHAQEALLAGLEKCLTIDDFLLGPFIDMWLDFVDQKAPRCIAEHLMFFAKYVSVHDYLPLNVGGRFSKNA
jgi:hypothetical protein